MRKKYKFSEYFINFLFIFFFGGGVCFLWEFAKKNSFFDLESV